MNNPFKRQKKLKLKAKDLLFRAPKTYLKCDRCGRVRILDGTVYGTDPIFVGMHRKCKTCGYHLYKRINKKYMKNHGYE